MAMQQVYGSNQGKQCRLFRANCPSLPCAVVLCSGVCCSPPESSNVSQRHQPA